MSGAADTPLPSGIAPVRTERQIPQQPSEEVRTVRPSDTKGSTQPIKMSSNLMERRKQKAAEEAAAKAENAQK